MIHSLYMANWKRHHDKTFFFSDGLNIIVGENEAGKSLILEAIDFALHGSVALRLSVSEYPKNLTSILEVTILGQKYKIHRTLKKAEIYLGDQLLASGTKPVDAEVRKIFGYSRNVFLVANYSSQDSINYLSQMKPTERKRVIDNVVGLSAVEQLIAECKAELTINNRLIAEHKKLEPRQTVEKPLTEYDPNWMANEVKLKNQVDVLRSEKTQLEVIYQQHLNLDESYPYLDQVPESEKGKEIIGLTHEMINQHDQNFALLNAKMGALDNELKKLLDNPIKKPKKPEVDKIIPNLTVQQAITGHNERNQIVTQLKTYEEILSMSPNVAELQTYSDSEIEAVKKQTELYQEWLKVQKIKQTGTISCPECKHNFFLEHDKLLTQYSHIPENVEKPSLDYQEMVRLKNHYDSSVKQRENTENLLNKTRQQLADFDSNWYSDMALTLHIEQSNALKEYEEKLKPEYDAYISKWVETDNTFNDVKKQLADLINNWHTASAIEQHKKALQYKQTLEIYQAGLTQWEKSKSSLPDFNETKQNMEHVTEQLAVLTEQLEVFTKQNQQWAAYLHEAEIYKKWYDNLQNFEFAAELESNKIKTLQLFKEKIKSAILPSVNLVASTWLRKMSMESHYSVNLTDNMDILVDDEPIEALSISGRALGHLALRMALGQVLTNNVFPVFMADEVDASMRNNRSQAVLDSLVDMLQGSVKQLIVITHRNIDATCNYIEV